MGVVTGVLVIFLALCLPLVYVAITSLVAGIDGKATGGENAGLKDTVHVVVNETSAFLRDIPKRGRSVTTDLLSHLQLELTSSLSKLVKEIMEQLLTRYNVNTLVDQATNLSKQVTGLQNTVKYVLDAKSTTLGEIKNFQQKMNQSQKELENNLQELCKGPQPPGQSNECRDISEKISKLNLGFNASSIVIDDTLIQLTSKFGSNLTDVLKKFEKMRLDLDSRIENIILEIKTNFDLTKRLEPMLQLWDKVGTEVSEPVIQQLDQIEPTVDDALTTAAKFTKIGGFIVLILFTAVLVIILVFGIITAVQAAKDSNGSRCCLLCGLILPVIFCFLIPLLVLVSGVLVLVSGLIANEGCRYVGNPPGVVVTDGALNLYVRYMWPQLLSDQLLDPSISAMLDIPMPRNVLNGILIQCKASTEQNGSRSVNPGLFPALGVDRFLNATAIVEQPDLQKAITETEQTLVQKIRAFDFNATLPANVDEIRQLITQLEEKLNKTNNEGAVSEFEKVKAYTEQLKTLLDQLEEFINPFQGYPSAQNIQRNILQLRKNLEDSTGIFDKITELINALKALQQTLHLLDELQQFATTLDEVFTVLKSPEKIEAPIHEVYQSGVKDAMNLLVTLLEQSSSGYASDVLKCGNINVIVTSVIGATCANDGLFNRFGGFFFMMLLYLCPLLLTVLFYQIFLQQSAKS
ncbi:hypothetical protein CRM22_001484 [Opisthorchis felineus]|uniref:Uncharacterized protein n=1 Tax=Opisthorchis felineus TaxID=147828 RepID=A0A4S2MAM4_OPIFE|nr:hypothetical protein CRM22_001484 [Opisthorchis felineus]